MGSGAEDGHGPAESRSAAGSGLDRVTTRAGPRSCLPPARAAAWPGGPLGRRRRGLRGPGRAGSPPQLRAARSASAAEPGSGAWGQGGRQRLTPTASGCSRPECGRGAAAAAAAGRDAEAVVGAWGRRRGEAPPPPQTAPQYGRPAAPRGEGGAAPRPPPPPAGRPASRRGRSANAAAATVARPAPRAPRRPPRGASPRGRRPARARREGDRSPGQPGPRRRPSAPAASPPPGRKLKTRSGARKHIALEEPCFPEETQNPAARAPGLLSLEILNREREMVSSENFRLQHRTCKLGRPGLAQLEKLAFSGGSF